MNRHHPLGLVLAVLAAAPARADIIAVPKDHPTIQKAIDAASDNDDVIVAPGVYYENLHIPAEKNITLRSVNPADWRVVSQTIIDGSRSVSADQGSVITMVADDITDGPVIAGFTVRHGTGNGPASQGGGIHCVRRRASLHNLLITANQAVLGGGVYCQGADLAISDCRFADNHAERGGALCAVDSAPAVQRCAMTANSAARGAAVAVSQATARTVIGNCLIADNAARPVSGEAAGSGGIETISSPLVVAGCTLSGNYSAGGGVLTGESGPIEVINSILWGNLTDGGAAAIHSTAGRVRISYSDIQGGPQAVITLDGATLDWDLDSNINFDPLFVEAWAGDYHLQAASPARDAGTTVMWNVPDLLIADLDGDRRIVGSGIDMGADEVVDCNGNGLSDSADLLSGVSTDCDGNNVPDECDPDGDGDGIIDRCDYCPVDALKSEPGPCGCGVADSDGDADGVVDCVDLCPGYDDAVDQDADGLPDGCDACPQDPGKFVPGICGCDVSDADTDGDSVADCNDRCPGHNDVADQDGDGVADGCDNCPQVPNVAQADRDGNGIGDSCDHESCSMDAGCDDGWFCNGRETCVDGVCRAGLPPCSADQICVDNFDRCVSMQRDLDGDGIGDLIDNCPAVENPDQRDADGNGIGDVCDPDDDGDGVSDNHDRCPGTPLGTAVNDGGCGLTAACDAAARVSAVLASQVIHKAQRTIVEYVITVTNDGSGSACDVVLAALLAPQFEIITASHGAIAESDGLHWPTFDLAPGASLTRKFCIATSSGGLSQPSDVMIVIDPGGGSGGQAAGPPMDWETKPDTESEDDPEPVPAATCGAGACGSGGTLAMLLTALGLGGLSGHRRRRA